MREIELTRGKVALVDDEDFEELNRYKWYANMSGTRCYASRMTTCENRRVVIRMHREIMNTPEGFDTDHIDHDTLNNQKPNLRVVTRRENMQNLCNKTSTSSRFSGVCFSKTVYRRKPWMAGVRINGKSKTIGMFLTEEEAHQAYLKAIP